jgi:hypothetical protein
MSTRRRSLALSLGTAAGGLLATLFLPAAVAFADSFDFSPDTSTFVPAQLDGYPPLYDVVVGSEKWSITDLTTNSSLQGYADDFTGTDTQTTFGSFTNNEFLTSQATAFLEQGANPVTFEAPAGSEFDLANFGLGFANAWMDLPGGPDAGASDLLITPFGDFALFGTGFAELATVLG